MMINILLPVHGNVIPLMISIVLVTLPGEEEISLVLVIQDGIHHTRVSFGRSKFLLEMTKCLAALCPILSLEKESHFRPLLSCCVPHS